MPSVPVPRLQSRQLSKDETSFLTNLMILLFITFAFGVMIMLLQKTFKLIVKPFPNTAPEDVRIIHTKYLPGINIAMLIYLFFLVITLMTKVANTLANVKFLKWIFALINLGVGVAVLTLSIQSLKKLDEAGLKTEFKDYIDTLNWLVSVSVIVIVFSFLWIAINGKSEYNALKSKT